MYLDLYRPRGKGELGMVSGFGPEQQDGMNC